MSNVFVIQQTINNTLEIDCDTAINGSLTIDGYVIEPANAASNQVLQYNGAAYVPATIQESNVANLVSDLASKTPDTRNINTTSRLTGGGDLTADRIIDLATSGVNAGTYTSVTVDAYGRVTTGSNPGSGITGTFSNNQIIYGNTANSTVQSSSNLTFDGYELGVNHIKSLGGSPTIARGSYAYNNSTIGITGTDICGQITFNGGSYNSGTSGTAVAVITFATAFSSPPIVILSPASQNGLTNGIWTTSTTTTWTLNSFNQMSNYTIVPVWNYIVIG